MNNIWNNIKSNFSKGSVLMQLLYINIGAFVLIKLAYILLVLFNLQIQSIYSYLEVPASLETLLMQPWSIITYMFMHLEFSHIFFNMLCLYWFGKIFLEFLSEKQLVGVYIISGLGGALTYIAAYNIFPYFGDAVGNSYLLGASASVMGIMLTATTMSPNYKIRLFIVGEVKLLTLSLIMIGISVLSVTSSNAGGEFSHIGGALFGYIYAMRLKKGKDMSAPVTWVINKLSNLFKPKPRIKIHKFNAANKVKTDAEYNKERAQSSLNVDIILDKIKQSGYNSLTEKEKKQLFEQSKNI